MSAHLLAGAQCKPDKPRTLDRVSPKSTNITVRSSTQYFEQRIRPPSFLPKRFDCSLRTLHLNDFPAQKVRASLRQAASRGGVALTMGERSKLNIGELNLPPDAVWGRETLFLLFPITFRMLTAFP